MTNAQFNPNESYDPYQHGQGHGQYGQPGYDQGGYGYPGHDGGYGPSGYGQPPPYGYSTPPGHGGAPNPQERSDASTANYLGLLSLIGPWGWIGPLIYRNGAGMRSPFVRASATAALNFHLSLLIYGVGGAFLSCLLGVLLAVVTLGVGAVLWWLIAMALGVGLTVWAIVGSCIGGSYANRGEVYNYPGSINMVK